MKQVTTYDVIVAGGGLAGLSAAILLGRQGYQVMLIEKNFYPVQRVCGEYIGEESRDFLMHLGCEFPDPEFPKIRNLQVSAPDGSFLFAPLNPGGFGASRYGLDARLAGLARSAGVEILEGHKVDDITFESNQHHVFVGKQVFACQVALGCFGKRSNLDVRWKRSFIGGKPHKLNNYIGIKYHIRCDLPADRIALHNFQDGYCGISAVEGGEYCLCYMTSAANLGLCNNSISAMEQEILCRNPHLARIWKTATFVSANPVSISQISFSPKKSVESHVLMAGDSAGMISPLCGNGMSMALRAGKMAAGAADGFLRGQLSRASMENVYSRQWARNFSSRLRAGRIIQRFFGDPALTRLLVGTAKKVPMLTQFLIRQTHGNAY
ncbi:NAD(P)/FAD-dependent oxidoreductase [Flavihumibacter petaseus]|uniref:Putative oxidoreductase n=1 Tax=Flavihumibacter petaseus NBRC 106054 TaxID=1220578 RepID=A0A0E9N4V3_9BACT|nr:NAD(P)/FAD-dependent oxidoreductase [Flavihumibacter petaseus]GAO44987.1 putative oxidoreductase [Flavihumibacter petaseus NBRC 106054]